MPTVDVVIESPVSQSMRCRQVSALFDVPPQQRQTLRWRGEVPIHERPWNIGLIVGPSGSGKTTCARALFGDEALRAGEFEWTGAAVLDDFPDDVRLEDIAKMCQAVGFNTMPAWLRPFRVLSNGEKFRVTLARLLAERKDLVVLDEFTSVVDRQVARIGAHAVQKYVRRHDRKFVAVSCHSDIIEWLNPDWILEPATMTFTWRDLQRRPPIECTISRVSYAAWRLFAPYHYMTAELNPTAQCFALFIGDEPVTFAGVLYRPHSRVRNIWGISRLVTLPDYQGLGLAFVMMDTLGSAFRALGQRLRMYPAHPGLTRSMDRSARWRLARKPGLIARSRSRNSRVPAGSFGGRPNAVFEYVGEPMADCDEARRFLGIRSLA